MTNRDFIPKSYPFSIEKGHVSWSSPSNIALVKYWGKKKNQIPENPSISFTLSHSKTLTTLHFEKKDDTQNFEFDVYLEGEKKDDFKDKIQTFFERVEKYLPFLKAYRFKIETSNTFPHSSGIASSASGMSALALCLMSVEKQLLFSDIQRVEKDQLYYDTYFKMKASFLARLGSGSASRSIEGDLVVWGKHKAIPASSNLYGIKYPYDIHPNFKQYQDTILLVDKGQKVVSSTVGHNLMFDHPYAYQRFRQAHTHLETIMSCLKSGDFDAFIAVVESEALTLHAMMLTSMPYFILMKPNTLHIINLIWQFRKKTNSKVCFTLDAGANVHVLYPKKESQLVLEFIKSELVAYCENGHYICDEIGNGAKQLQ